MSDMMTKVERPAWYDSAVASFKTLAEKFSVITSTDQLPEASSLLAAIAEKKKAIVDGLAKPKKLAHDTHKSITTLEKDLLGPFEELDKIVRKALGAFAGQEEEKRLAKVRAEQELASVVEEMGGFEDDAPAVVYTPEPKIAVAGLSFREITKFRIVNRDLIPAKYTIPDIAAIQSLVDQMGERAVVSCPGIEVYVERVPVRR